MKTKQPFAVAGVIAISIGMLLFIFAGYWLHWTWTGFNKPLWDWMQLLLIPVALALVAVWFNRIERRNDQGVALDNQRETSLQTYLDRMSDLLLKEDLLASKPSDKVRNVARARTLTLLHQLDTERKVSVLQFLYESHLIKFNAERCVLSLKGANLSNIYLHNEVLREINLSDTNLFNADLRGTDFYFANLSGTHFNKADLRGTHFDKADLRGTNFSEADLRGADFSKADLRGAKLTRANLSGVDFSKADLRGADLSGADLRWADLSNANLFRTQLRRVRLNNAKLSGTDLSTTYFSGTSFKKVKFSSEQKSLFATESDTFVGKDQEENNTKQNA